MIDFILNNQDISTDLPHGMTVLDFARYRQNLKGTKIGCREGDCGACTIIVGELVGDDVRYRTMTSCLMPLANADGKHIVTIEGINPEDGSLTPVQQAMVDESGTQCGFCTVGFVMSLTGFCVDHIAKTPEMAVSSIDGNICRCTGYKSIERAAESVCSQLAEGRRQFVPEYFAHIPQRLEEMSRDRPQAETRAAASVPLSFVSGGTDVYVQKPDALAESDASHLFYDENLRGIRDNDGIIEIGASATVTDIVESPVMQAIFPDLYKHLKLVSSTPIRNMATLAGNFINASPIGDMTVWFLALDADVVFNDGRDMPLRKLYIDYKKLAKTDQEFITAIRFRKPGSDVYFNFEKVCKRTCLDIATVNTAISLRVESTPGPGWIPPVLRDERQQKGDTKPGTWDLGLGTSVDHKIISAHVSAGGVAPIPLYLKATSAFLNGKQITAETIADANEIMQSEISPISDVRGTVTYKRLLLRQLFRAHFVELFATEITENTE